MTADLPDNERDLGAGYSGAGHHEAGHHEAGHHEAGHHEVAGSGRSAGSFGEALSAAVDALEAVGVDTPRLDAELMLCAAAGTTREELAASPEALLDASAGRRFSAFVRRRLQREPVAYILGRRAFRYLELACDPRALIPRPETEMLVDFVLDEEATWVLEIGTGSGAVAVATTSEMPNAMFYATDASSEALDLARENAIKVGVADRIIFELGTLPSIGEFDMVVANLPYVPEGDWSSLDPEITRYEPREALVGGIDGLAVIRSVLAELSGNPKLHTPIVALEIGEGQAIAVAELLVKGGWRWIETRHDLAGIERVVIGRHGP